MPTKVPARAKKGMSVHYLSLSLLKNAEYPEDIAPNDYVCVPAQIKHIDQYDAVGVARIPNHHSFVFRSHHDATMQDPGSWHFEDECLAKA